MRSATSGSITPNILGSSPKHAGLPTSPHGRQACVCQVTFQVEAEATYQGSVLMGEFSVSPTSQDLEMLSSAELLDLLTHAGHTHVGSECLASSSESEPDCS